MTGEIRIIPLEGIPEVEEGDDLVTLLADAAQRAGGLEDADVIVVAQKVVSKAEGRVVRMDEIEPSERRSKRGTRLLMERGTSAED